MSSVLNRTLKVEVVADHRDISHHSRSGNSSEGSPRSIINCNNSYCIECDVSSYTTQIEDSELCLECIEKQKKSKKVQLERYEPKRHDEAVATKEDNPSHPELQYSDQARSSSSSQIVSAFLSTYHEHVAERAALAGGVMGGVVPKPLNAIQTLELVGAIKKCSTSNYEDDEDKQIDQGTKDQLIYLLSHRVPPGVDDAAKIKAEFLSEIVLAKIQQNESTALISQVRAVELLGTMQGGYNVDTLIQLLECSNAKLRGCAAEQLKHTLLVFRAFDDVLNLYKSSTASVEAREATLSVLESWANAEWFTSKPNIPDKITVTVFKVTGESNTDDLSPAPDAWSRPDIPLHALAMLKNVREGVTPEINGEVGPLSKMDQLLKTKGHPLAYVGDVVGTGSSRKSAANSVIWYMGQDIPYVPNVKRGGVCIGGKIAPIFFNTMEDSGALPIEMENVSKLHMGDVIDIYPREGRVINSDSGELISTFELKTRVLLDEVRAGGRIPLIIGKGLTYKARLALGRDPSVSNIFATLVEPKEESSGMIQQQPRGYTLAQKIVGKACGVEGVRPGKYCEPKIATVGSQDTTGPMTRDELCSLACVQFSADLVMQSFCHTAAYPKPVDLETHNTLPGFFTSRGGISLRPGDGVIHAWLNRMLVPDTVGTGGDSHTRFPLGISFPAGSGLVAFAAATGTLPLDMPESVLVKFTGTMQPGITLRDLVQAIPYTAIQRGLLTVDKKGKKNVFSGRIVEIEGLPNLTCEQAFELSDSSAERSAAGCTIKLETESVIKYLKSNVVMLKWMISEGYRSRQTIERRIARMEEWLTNPQLMEADDDAKYAEVIEINMGEITQPILALPNDPDACALLSEVAGKKIDEVFLGSCMTNIGHFRAAGKLLDGRDRSTDTALPTKLWIAPPTKMDNAKLEEEGYLNIFADAGARIEMPGCSLCMGNQARVEPGCTVVSTSTRNFPNRLGQGSNVYLASAELAVIASIEGKFPSVDEYRKYMAKISATEHDTFRYLKFNELSEYVQASKKVDDNSTGA